jgi:hypothetical protein
MIIGDIYNKLYNLTKPPVNDAMKVMNLINGGEIVVRLIWQPVKSDTLFKNFDVDLHIVEPDGTHVYWNNMEGSVGFLDRDVEVAYWPDTIDDVETYAVCSRPPSPQPTTMPTTYPTTKPTTQPTTNPTKKPTTKPATKPITEPNTEPTTKPTTQPFTPPIFQPIFQPSIQPAAHFLSSPSEQPSTAINPSSQPSSQPFVHPFRQPINQPSAQPISQSTLNTLRDTLYSNKMRSSSAKIGSDESIHTHTYIATEEVSTGANENSKNPQVK